MIRSGHTDDFTLQVGRLGTPTGTAAARQTPSRGGASELAKLGLRVRTLTPEVASQAEVRVEHGVLITSVQEGSPASLADLQAGDIIEQANRKPVNRVEDLVGALESSQGQILLLISRKGQSAYVVLSLQ